MTSRRDSTKEQLEREPEGESRYLAMYRERVLPKIRELRDANVIGPDEGVVEVLRKGREAAEQRAHAQRLDLTAAEKAGTVGYLTQKEQTAIEHLVKVCQNKEGMYHVAAMIDSSEIPKSWTALTDHVKKARDSAVQDLRAAQDCYSKVKVFADALAAINVDLQEMQAFEVDFKPRSEMMSIIREQKEELRVLREQSARLTNQHSDSVSLVKRLEGELGTAHEQRKASELVAQLVCGAVNAPADEMLSEILSHYRQLASSPLSFDYESWIAS